MAVVSKTILVEALQKTALAITDKPGTYSPDSIQSDGEYLYGFNDVVGTKIEAGWLAGIRFSVHGPTLLQAAKACEAADIELTIAKDDLLIRGGKSKTKLKLMEDKVKERYNNVFPFDPDWATFPNVSEGAKPLLFPSAFKFSGVFFSGESMYSADARFSLRTIMDAHFNDLWLSFKHMKLVAAFGDIDSVIVRASWAHFQKGTSVISVRRLLETNYPSKVVKSLFERADELPFKAHLSKTLIDAIKRSIPFADTIEDGSLEGTIDFQPEKITIATEAKGSAFEIVVEQHTNLQEPITLRLDLRAFAKCVRYMTEGELSIMEGKRKRLFIDAGNLQAAVSVD